MTLYELTNAATLQGNIEMKIFGEDGDEKESRFFLDQDDFFPAHEDCDDVEDFRVSYIYYSHGCDGTPWLVIEIVEV